MTQRVTVTRTERTTYKGLVAARSALILALIGACGRSPSEAPVAAAANPKPIAIDPPVGPGATSPNLVAVSEGALLTWLEPVDGGKAHRLRFARFTRGAWGQATTITESANIVANWADVPSIAQQADGVVVAHWAEKAPSPESHAYNAVVARSIDSGVTWHRLGALHRDGTATEHGFVTLLPDGRSTLAVWLDGRAMANGAPGATMLRAVSIGEAIGPEQVVDNRVCDCCSTSAAMTDGGPAVAFRDRSEDELRDPWIVRRVGSAWSPSRAVHADGWNIAGCPVNGPMIVAAGREVVVAWYTLADKRPTVRVAFSGDAGATFDQPIEVDGANKRAPIGRVDVVIDRPGDAIVSWVAAEGDDGRLLARRITRDRRRGAELELATVASARAGGFPRMESVGDEIVVAWTDARTSTVRALRIARASLPPALDK